MMAMVGATQVAIDGAKVDERRQAGSGCDRDLRRAYGKPLRFRSGDVCDASRDHGARARLAHAPVLPWRSFRRHTHAYTARLTSTTKPASANCSSRVSAAG